MGVYEAGTVCIKLMGREAGYPCVIVEVIDKNFALIDGLKVRRRRVNFAHIAPTKDKVEIKKGADTKAVAKAIEKAKLKEKFETQVKPKLQL